MSIVSAKLMHARCEHVDAVYFGQYRLCPTSRTLFRDDLPVDIGSRALDILIMLVERAGQVVSQGDLLAGVWRGLVVDPANVRVHVMKLRQALDGGRSYILNIPGQGYSFTAPIRLGSDRQKGCFERDLELPKRMLPPPLLRVIGREDTIRLLARDVQSQRLVTIVGPGGIGKTTVAMAVARTVLGEFSDAICFVDFSSVGDPALVAHTVTTALDVSTSPEDACQTLIEVLRFARMLLVFDNCEHVIESVASLAESIHREASGVHILVTSREALRVPGERSHWLPPLATPPVKVGLCAAEAMRFTAVALFVERASSAARSFELTDANAPTVAYICDKMDGIPLAIEIAASRAAVNGIEDTAWLLNEGFSMRWPGRRTALPRHQTLQAVLDWSYNLLPDIEQRVLRRIAVLERAFSVALAQLVATAADVSTEQVLASLDQLVAKSLVSAATASDGSTRYRLFDTTRRYALAKLEESGDRSPGVSIVATHFDVATMTSAQAGRSMRPLESSESEPSKIRAAEPGTRVSSKCARS